MTPQQHIARAERLLDELRKGSYAPDDSVGLALALEAQANALVALAVQLGIPHPAIAAEASDDGT